MVVSHTNRITNVHGNERLINIWLKWDNNSIEKATLLYSLHDFDTFIHIAHINVVVPLYVVRVYILDMHNMLWKLEHQSEMKKKLQISIEFIHLFINMSEVHYDGLKSIVNDQRQRSIFRACSLQTDRLHEYNYYTHSNDLQTLIL